MFGKKATQAKEIDGAYVLITGYQKLKETLSLAEMQAIEKKIGRPSSNMSSSALNAYARKYINASVELRAKR